VADDPQPQVLYAVADHIATVTLNRPDRANAATIDMGEQLQQHMRAADLDDDVRVVVLTGAGDAFCAGDDVEGAWGDPRMAEILAGLGEARPPLTPEVQAILDCRKPVLAAVNGIAVGSGMDMALASDIILASETARFGQAYVRMGLMADVLGYWRLPQLVGPGRAAELLFTGAVIDAAEANRIGLVNTVVPAEELPAAVQKLAKRIAGSPPIAVRYLKEGLRRGTGRPASDLPELAAFVGNGLARLFTTKDHHEAVAAFVEKRKPVFSGQ
jgi:enoyl-CoA hydratase/carnithine racemase